MDNQFATVQANGGVSGAFLWYPYGSVSQADVSNWMDAGFAFGIHFNDGAETDGTGVSGAKVTWQGMNNVVSSALASFSATYPGITPSTATRNHFLLWASADSLANPDQTAQAKIFATNGIQMDATMSAFPRRWGYMTGSGLTEKANDLVVAPRMKNGKMHWSRAGANAVALLRAHVLNDPHAPILPT